MDMILIIVIIALISILAFLIWQTAIVELLLLAKCHGSRNSQVIGLSFDDGPDWGEEKLIEALNDKGIKATFFWICEKVQRLDSQNHQILVELLKLLKQGQHEVGIHALSCNVPTNPIRRILGFTRSTDIIKAQEELFYLLGYQPRLYRPHCIQLGRGMYKGIKKSEVTFVVGSILHTVGNKKKNLGSKYLNTIEKARPGDIICGHDSIDCDTNAGIAIDIVKVIPQLEGILKKRKFKARTVSEVINPTVHIKLNDFKRGS